MLLTYNVFSEVCIPVDFLTVDDSYSMMSCFAHFSLSDDDVQSVIYAVGSVSILPCASFGAFV